MWTKDVIILLMMQTSSIIMALTIISQTSVDQAVSAFYFQHTVLQIQSGIWYFMVFEQAKLHKENYRVSTW